MLEEKIILQPGGVNQYFLSPYFVIRHLFAPELWLKGSVFLSTRSF